MDTTESTSGTTPKGERELDRYFAELVKAMQKDVFGFHLIRTRNEADAWDLTQETFLRVWKSWCDFDRSKDGRPWIMKIAENALLDHFRAQSAQKRGRPVSLDREFRNTDHDGKKSQEPADSRWPDQVDALIQAESIAAMDKAATSLTENDRILYRLRRDGLSNAEIARRTGRSEKSIGPALTRLVGRLRSILAREKQ
jgi:RNA polymerase sigma-70 factor (ECF subfamily)